MEWTTWFGALIALGIALLANIAVAVLVKIAASRYSSQESRWLRTLIVRLHLRIQVFVAVVALWIVGTATAPATFAWWITVDHLFLIATVIAGAWLLSGLLTFGVERVKHRVGEGGENEPEIRRKRTQIDVLHRLGLVLIAIIAVGVVLFTFPMVRAVGASVLASAGILSVVAGLAAQSTLGNLIAGLQLAFSNSLRVGDVVVAEGEWGTVGEITLTHVVVHVWDERRLILPCTYFTSQPYENWTRQNARIMGTVYMDLDWRVPIAQVREKFAEILATTDLWDRRVSSVLVTGAEGGFVTVRFLVSSKDSDQQWALRCLVREEMVSWLQREHPEALPYTRVMLSAPGSGPEAGSAKE